MHQRRSALKALSQHIAKDKSVCYSGVKAPLVIFTDALLPGDDMQP